MTRANQGHSVEVDLQLEAREPPESLYHGTVERFLPSIWEEGLVRGERHHVHLSKDTETARIVAWTCALAPDSGIAAGRLLKLAEAAALGSNQERAAEALGAAAYRAGQDLTAVRHLQDALKLDGKGGSAQQLLFLSMAHLRRGNRDRARNA